MTTSESRRYELAHIATILMVASLEDKTEVYASHVSGTETLETYGTLQESGADGKLKVSRVGERVVLHVSDGRGAGLEESFDPSDLDDNAIAAFASRAQVAMTLGLAAAGGPITVMRNFEVRREPLPLPESASIS